MADTRVRHRHPPIHDSLHARFWRYVVPGPLSECWMWFGTRNEHDYGTLTNIVDGKRKTIRAHRVSFEIHNGPIAEGLFIRHKCDQPRCVNPSHLELGNAKENSQDMMRRKRHPFARGVVFRGEQSGGARLTEDQVRAIRTEYSAGGTTYRRIADKYGVTPTGIMYICKRVNWSHVA